MSTRSYNTQSKENLVVAQPESPALTQTIVTVDSTYTLAERDAFRDRLRATLAKEIMDNTAALSSVESYYLKIAPSGAEEYRQIVQTYTTLALVKLVHAEW